MTPYGFINLLKPPGLTSHAAVSRMRRLLGTKAVGHAGTLDPAASGVLPLAVGRATRLLEYLVVQEKVYTAEAIFGVATDTLDQEGEIVWRADQPPFIQQATLAGVLTSFVGKREQVPPAYSAIKFQGRPLYEYARAGKIVQVPGREIEVHTLSVRAYHPDPWPRLLFQVSCSKGTYVRVLVQEIAEKLGTQATLTFLLREQVGCFSLETAFTLEEVECLVESNRVADCILSPAIVLTELPQVALELDIAQRFLLGQRISLEDSAPEGIAAVFQAEQLLGVGKVTQGVLAPHKVLAKWEELI